MSSGDESQGKGFSFTLQAFKGKAVNNIRKSPIAQDLLGILEQSKKASELMDVNTYEFTLDKHFVLRVTKQVLIESNRLSVTQIGETRSGQVLTLCVRIIPESKPTTTQTTNPTIIQNQGITKVSTLKTNTDSRLPNPMPSKTPVMPPRIHTTMASITNC